MSPPVRSTCCVLYALGHYHHARLQAAAATGPPLTVVEVHGESDFREFRLDGPVAASNYSVVKAGGRVAETLERLRPGVAFLPGWGDRFALAGLRWCQRTRTPAVVMSESTRHDSIGDRDADPGRPVRRPWWREAVKQRLVRQFSAALVGGTPHRDYVVELGLPPGRVFDGYDVVDNDYFAAGADAARADPPAARAKHNLPERFFLASARFIAKKNLDRLIRAFAAYRKTAGAAAWDLVLLGDGPQKPRLTQLIAELAIRGSVHLPGFKPFTDLPAHYGLAGAFVHPSTTEQWGLVVNEAMAAGLAVVVSRTCGCAPDLVTDGVTGLAVDPYDPADITRALATVAAPEFDRAAMGRAAQERIAAWSPARFASNFWRSAEAAMAVGPRPRRLTSRVLLSVLGR
jgi:glycosyltransferase involved in cell wall biosynthesis